MGSKPKRIYEIGSGKVELISYLANKGHICVATGITEERGMEEDEDSLIWLDTDGIHLDKYTESNYYDILISNQVIEYLNPDDIEEHFKGAYSILKKGGKYIFKTSHKYMGPSDLSRVFDYEEPVCMHLKEYTLNELKTLLKKTGFNKISSIIFTPIKLIAKTGIYMNPIQSEKFYKYLIYVEKLISIFPKKMRKKIAEISILILFSPIIFISAEKQ